MAYAGTPTGLAQQAGASRPWKTVLAAIAVLAIGLALVIAVMFVNSRAVAPATGRDDGLIEAQRDATPRRAARRPSSSSMARAMSRQKAPRPLPLVPGPPQPPGPAVTGTRLDTTWVPAARWSSTRASTQRGVRETSARSRTDIFDRCRSTSGSRPDGKRSSRRREQRTGRMSGPLSFSGARRRRHGVKGRVARDLTK